MAVRTYTNIDIVVVNETLIGVASGTKFNRGVTSGAFAVGPADQNGVSVYGYLDFTQFPSIPAVALISRIRCTADGSAGSNTTATTGGAQGESLIGILAVSLPGSIDNSDQVDLIAISPPSPDDETLLRQLVFQVDFTPPITRDELILRYGFGGGVFPISGSLLGIVVSALSEVTADVATAVGHSVISNWRFDVTYTGGIFQWYIKTTPTVINGGVVNVIEEAGDIIQVEDGDIIPDGYVLYGSSADFPSGPTYLWWSSFDFYLFYIYSPVSPGVGWTSGATPPTCSGCLTLTLGILTILIADASGIYTLTPGKRNETLYSRVITPQEIITQAAAQRFDFTEESEINEFPYMFQASQKMLFGMGIEGAEEEIEINGNLNRTYINIPIVTTALFKIPNPFAKIGYVP